MLPSPPPGPDQPGGSLRGLFIAGTDTGVGKTVVACAIAATLAGRGERVAVFKPAVTGLDELEDPLLADHQLLLASARSGQTPVQVAPYRFGPATSPHLAAELAGNRIEPAALIASAFGAASAADALVVEGVGGLLVPLARGYLVRDFAAELGLPLVVAARPGLGTVNHSLLTIEAARVAGLSVAAVVFTPWPEEAGRIECSNAETVASLGQVNVHTLGLLSTRPPVSGVSELPIDSWLEQHTQLAQEAPASL